MKLLGLTIDKKLDFRIHINNICRVASAKLKGLGGIRIRLNLSQTKNLCNSFILSSSTIVAFSVCSVMFCSRMLQNKINQIPKRALQIVLTIRI